MTTHFVKDKETFNIGGIKVTGFHPWEDLMKDYTRRVIRRIQCVISLNMRVPRLCLQAIRSSLLAVVVSSREPQKKWTQH
jgi:hypothetical protein